MKTKATLPLTVHNSRPLMGSECPEKIPDPLHLFEERNVAFTSRGLWIRPIADGRALPADLLTTLTTCRVRCHFPEKKIGKK